MLHFSRPALPDQCVVKGPPRLRGIMNAISLVSVRNPAIILSLLNHRVMHSTGPQSSKIPHVVFYLRKRCHSRARIDGSEAGVAALSVKSAKRSRTFHLEISKHLRTTPTRHVSTPRRHPTLHISHETATAIARSTFGRFHRALIVPGQFHEFQFSIQPPPHKNLHHIR